MFIRINIKIEDIFIIRYEVNCRICLEWRMLFFSDIGSSRMGMEMLLILYWIYFILLVCLFILCVILNK